MDGVLVNSEPLWQRAEIEIFPAVGIELTTELCRTTMGLRIDEVVSHWYSIRPWAEPSKEEMARRIVERVAELIEKEGRLLPGVDAALGFFGERARLALASSSYYRLIDAVLDGFGLRHRFEVVYSAEDEPRGKPDPGIYRTTATKLGCEPERCLAIEDSANGVLAAKAAGMWCIAVPDDANRGDEGLDRADEMIPSLESVDADLWERFSSRA